MLTLCAVAVSLPFVCRKVLSKLLDPAPRGFRIVREIGQGGMGVVYEAVDEALQRRVALKRLRDGIAADPEERRRLLEEARTVAALKHPNIVEIHSVIESRAGLFLVFEYVEGRTLWELTARGPWAPESALPILRQIAGALDYAHALGIVHRDLKPSNVMITADGAVKLMDFGIARRVEDLALASARPHDGGTPGYMAPEQDIGLALRESDLFSLGVCLYEMLAGFNPFADPAAAAARRARPISELAPGLPAALDAVLAGALCPAPEGRPPSAGAFLADLEKALA
jgi:eukaryotic-like serine/threonine-protein kinase